MFGRILFLGLLTTFGVSFVYTWPAAVEERCYEIKLCYLPGWVKGGHESSISNLPMFIVIRNKGRDQIIRSKFTTKSSTEDFTVTAKFGWRQTEVYTIEVLHAHDCPTCQNSNTFDHTDGRISIPASQLVGTHSLANPSGLKIEIKQIG